MTQARKTTAVIAFDGVDITKDISPYLLGLTYTDCEDGEADDLQIRLQDRDGIWLESWAGQMVEAAADGGDTETARLYRVIATGGVNVRSQPSEEAPRIGALVYADEVGVAGSENNWSRIWYAGGTGYVESAHLEPVAADTGWAIGDTVTVTGQPMYTSYGGSPGDAVENYESSIAHLNMGEGIPYPIHVGSLGWFAEAQVQRLGADGSPLEIVRSSGLKIRAAIRTEAGELDCGQFELDTLACSGPPAVVNVKTTALPFTSKIRLTRKNKAWENYRLSGIAGEIAQKAGLACMYLPEDDPEYARVEQYQCGDIAFLAQLCREAGYSLKCANNMIVIFEQSEFEGAEPLRTIKKGDKSYLSYKLNTKEADAHYASCRVRWTAPDGSLIEGVARVADYDPEDTANEQLELRRRCDSVAEAEHLAEKYLRLHNKHQRQASFTLPGDVTIGAGLTVRLSGWGLWDGKYIVTRAVHTVSGGYTTQIELRKCLEGY